MLLGRKVQEGGEADHRQLSHSLPTDLKHQSTDLSVSEVVKEPNNTDFLKGIVQWIKYFGMQFNMLTATLSPLLKCASEITNKNWSPIRNGGLQVVWFH